MASGSDSEINQELHFTFLDFPGFPKPTTVSTSEMRGYEERGEKLGISKMMMMENAGSAIARLVRVYLKEHNQKSKIVRVVFVAGTGNNGGDAFVAARHLAYWKENYLLSVVLIGNEEGIRTQEAFRNWQILRKIRRVNKIIISNIRDLNKLDDNVMRAGVVVSAIFGTGFRGAPRSLQALAISKINSSDAFTISVDIPSGMEADSGKSKHAVDSDVTICMHALKAGMIRTNSAREKCGQILVANIGLPF